MSFKAVRHEHPNIFVVNTQTYETYRLRAMSLPAGTIV